MSDYFLGIDLGTSGTRVAVIDECGRSVHFDRAPEIQTDSPQPGYREQNPDHWWQSVMHLIQNLPADIRMQLRSISVDGTSGTVLLCHENGEPASPALLYNDNRSIEEAREISRIAPAGTGAQGTGSSLSKLLWLLKQGYRGETVLHQADWITGKLCQRWHQTDSNNALKLGYDPVTAVWPDWLSRLDNNLPQLPVVHEPGKLIATIDAEIARQSDLPANALVCAGTTDSIAGFIATGANRTGDAVTTLGSTLVVKIINQRPVYEPAYGIYSHRLHDQWLVGGASNTGGAVLRQFFTVEEMAQLTPLIQPDKPTGLRAYPLPAPGERFPVNDPEKQPDIPATVNRLTFFQGLLEGIADIEKLAYEKLAEFGCPYPTQILTTGGGAKNAPWRAMRSRILGCKVLEPSETEAAYGAAQLAKKGYY